MSFDTSDFNDPQEKLENLRLEHMEQTYNRIPNPIILDPSENIYNKKYKFSSILDINTHRLIRLHVLKKFPGIEVECKWCGEKLRSYMKRLEVCSIIGLETKKPLLQIVTINLFDRCDITNKQHYIDLPIKIYLLFN